MLAAGVVSVAGGLSWVFGGWGLAGSGVGLLVAGLFFNFDDDGGEGSA